MASRITHLRSERIRGRVASLVHAQDGPVSRAQLVACGLTPSAVDARVARGALVAVHPGVYMLADQPLVRRGELAAAVLALPGPGLLSHDTGTELWEIEEAGGPLQVAVSRRYNPRIAGIRVHRSHVAPADRARCDGLPVTSVPRTLIDIAPGGKRRLRRAFEEAVREELITPESVRAACRRARGRAGVQRLRALLGEWTAPEPTRSELERRFLDLCRARDVPLPRMNARVAGWEVDAWWAGARLVVELDGYAFHGADRFQFERDRRKALALAAAGIELIRVGHGDVHARGAATAATITARLAARTRTTS